MRKKAALFTLLVLMLPGLVYPQNNIEDDPVFAKAERYFFQKKYEVARQYLIKVTQKHPDHPKAFSYLGDIALITGRHEEALQYYKIAGEVSANRDKEFFRIGQVYIKMEKADQALDSFHRAYSLNPGLKQALYQTGYVYLVFKRDKYKTIEYWKQFLKEAPNDAQYEKIKKVIALLEQDDFQLPPPGSDIPLEEALRLGETVEANRAKTRDQGAGHENEKTRNETEGLLDTLNGDEL